MTVMATMQPRRRVATYGKASRKPISGFNPVVADTFAQISLPDDVTSTPKYIPLRRSKEHKHNGTSIASAANPIPRVSSGRPDRILYSPTQAKASTEQRPCITLGEPATVYDVPLSDDGHDLDLGIGQEKGRKRRKITPKLGSRNVLLPDTTAPEKYSCTESSYDRSPLKGSLKKKSVQGLEDVASGIGGIPNHSITPPTKQRRAKADPQRHRTTSKSLRDNPRTTERKQIHNSKAPQEAVGKAKPSRKAIVETALPWKDPNKSLKRTSRIEEPDHTGKTPRLTSLRASHYDNQVRLSPTKDIPPPRTPSRSPDPAIEANTPHQRALWSMLLPAEPGSATPSSLNLPDLRLSDIQAHSPTLQLFPGDTLMADSVFGTTINVTRPKRLIDALQVQKEELDDADSAHEIESSTKLDDSSEENEAEEPYLAATDESLPSQATTIDHKGQSKTLPNGSQRVYSASQPLPTLQGGGLKMTYARQRSYLTEQDLSEAGFLGTQELQYPIAPRRTRRPALQDSPPRLQHVQSVHEELDEHGTSQGTILRSIHELREAGGNVRLISEIEGMLDDIADCGISLSLRRSRLLELTRRLQEAPFRQLFAEQEFELRLFNFIDHPTDPVLKTLVAAATLNLLTGPKPGQALSLLINPSVVDHLVALLDMDKEVTSMTKARALNMSRAAQLELKSYWDELLQSSVWRVEKPVSISPRVLALQCLEYLIRQAREAGHTDRLLHQHAIERIVGLLSLPVSVGPSAPHIKPDTNFQLSVSILESCTIVNQLHCGQPVNLGNDSLDAIATLLPSLETHFYDVPEALRALVLRLYLNLTNNSPELCEAFSRPAVLRSILDIIVSHFKLVSNEAASHTSHPLRLDILILALGSLINMVEWCAAVPQMILDLQQEHRDYLDHFVWLFQSSLQTTAEVSEPPWDMLSLMLI